jgi:selenide, water dikinase
VFRLNDGTFLVQTADFITPVVDDPFMYGKIAAANSLSDVYAMGGQAICCLNLVCYDSCNIDSHELRSILMGGLEAVREAGAVILGGHTVDDREMKFGLSVTGIVEERNITRNNGARPGDRLILTKPLGMGILTTANKADMASEKVMEEATAVMAMLNKGAALAMNDIGAHAATDITGFGLIGHALEAVDLAGMGLIPAGSYANRRFAGEHVRFESDIPDDQKMIYFDAQTSGGLFISVTAEKATRLLNKIRENGAIEAEIVGEVVEPEEKTIIFL